MSEMTVIDDIMNGVDINAIDYEQGVETLERVVKKMENDKLPLSDVMKLYEFAVKVAGRVESMLDSSEKTLETIREASLSEAK